MFRIVIGLKTQIVKEKVLLLLLKKFGGAGGKLLPPLDPLVPTALLQTVRSLRREFPWDY